MTDTPIRITMLGTTGVGKTTFLTAMYHELGEVGRNGFKLRAQRNAHIVLSRNWKELVQSHTWPKPNADYSEFHFELRHQDISIKEFDFVDYRGGAITDLEEAEHYKKLSNDVERSDGLLILGDSWYIANQTADVANAQNEIGTIQWFLEEFLIKHKHKKLIIGIVLTKIDLVKPEQYEEFKSRCNSVFKNLIDLAKKKKKQLRISFIPISVVGINTCKVEISQTKGRLPTIDCELVNDPAPVNVHWPILYCIAKSIEFRIDALNEVLALKKDELIDVQVNKSGVMDYLSAIFNGEALPYFKADQIYKEIENQKNEMSLLQAKVYSLVKEINGIGEAGLDDIFIP